MAELSAGAAAKDYRELLREAFIAPIRTAIVVDDEYPTLDELLGGLAAQIAKEEVVLDPQKRANAPQVRKILEFCRAQVPTPWLVDVHDGKTPPIEREPESASQLDFSDLLILDYHLEGNGSSKRAIDILQRLSGNGHFNLVVVYTKNRDGAGNGINITVNEIALALTSTIPDLFLDQRYVAKLRDDLSPWEEIDEGIYAKLLESVDEIAFLKILEQEDRRWSSLKDAAELAPLAIFLAAIPDAGGLSAESIFKLIIHERQKKFEPLMYQLPHSRAQIGRREPDTNWIRTDSLFVTVVSKEHEATQIPDRLLNALEAWDPEPQRLILSKMRSSLGQEGVIAETEILKNRFLQAGWLQEILEKDETKRGTNVRSNVARHWEGLSGKIEPKIMRFADQVATYLSGIGDRAAVQNRFDRQRSYQKTDEVSLELNCYACSKSVEGHHLFTGQVLAIEKTGKTIEYWLCLTPACDLVPGQGGDKGWKKRLGSWLPFKAVRLYKAEKSEALKYVTRGDYLFLRISGKTEAFGFAEIVAGEDRGVSGFRWEQLFAANDGIYGASKELQIAFIGDGKGPVFKEYKSVVVAQVRYEYAINLMHRLGALLSRVGLGFRSYEI